MLGSAMHAGVLAEAIVQINPGVPEIACQLVKMTFMTSMAHRHAGNRRLGSTYHVSLAT